MKLDKLFGIHAVQAALDYSPEKIQRVWVDSQRQDKRLTALLNGLSRHNITVEKSDRKELDRLSDHKNHQGIIADVQLPSLYSEPQLKQAINSLTTVPLFLVLDQVQDPHNLGACLRSADAAGVNGIIIPKDNASGITPTVCKVASGAAETVPIYQVTNLARCLRGLKEQGLWIVGSTGDAKKTVFETDLTLPLALVMGTEGLGMRKLTQQHCDFLVKIPMLGQVESLNISVAAGIMMYETLRQRNIML
ncbi:MAG: 23S rRNA (guanosine(2251)-2'-O)-methyltransferase RlmB [Methylococcales bacterium]|nr:23S rRNA (guanosine(2251)-2'-O)-methyltransferase RlmB [Methylococcales bacterium]